MPTEFHIENGFVDMGIAHFVENHCVKSLIDFLLSPTLHCMLRRYKKYLIDYFVKNHFIESQKDDPK